jgi:hypothetical protein
MSLSRLHAFPLSLFAQLFWGGPPELNYQLQLLEMKILVDQLHLYLASCPTGTTVFVRLPSNLSMMLPL